MDDPRDRAASPLFSARSCAWSGLERGVFALFVVGLVASLLLLVHPWYDPTNDGSTYLLTARSLAAGEGYRFLGAPFVMRPPGFAALIAPLVGTGEPSFAGINALVGLFGVAGVVLLYLHQRSRVGWPLALGTSLVVWLNPGFRRLGGQVMSDVPGLAIVLFCLLLERWASRRFSWWREIALGVAIGAGAWMRSITILVVPAILAARLAAHLTSAKPRERWPSFALRRCAAVALVALCVVLPWSLHRARNAPPPPADQTLNYSISTAMWHTDPGDPRSPRRSIGEILSRVPSRLAELSLVAGSRLDHRIPGSPAVGRGATIGRALASLLLLGCLLAVLARRRQPAEWFAVSVLAVVSLYFIFTDRLLLPVFVIALAAAVECLRDLARALAGPRAALFVPAALLLLLVAVDARPRSRWPEIRERHRAFVEMAAEIEATAGPEARLGAAQGFHYAVYLGRPVYSLMHTVRRAGRLDAAEQVIDRYGLDTVVLSPLVPPDRMLLPHFTTRYGAGHPAGPARVWRVRP